MQVKLALVSIKGGRKEPLFFGLRLLVTRNFHLTVCFKRTEIRHNLEKGDTLIRQVPEIQLKEKVQQGPSGQERAFNEHCCVPHAHCQALPCAVLFHLIAKTPGRQITTALVVSSCMRFQIRGSEEVLVVALSQEEAKRPDGFPKPLVSRLPARELLD